MIWPSHAHINSNYVKNKSFTKQNYQKSGIVLHSCKSLPWPKSWIVLSAVTCVILVEGNEGNLASSDTQLVKGGVLS